MADAAPPPIESASVAAAAAASGESEAEMAAHRAPLGARLEAAVFAVFRRLQDATPVGRNGFLAMQLFGLVQTLAFALGPHSAPWRFDATATAAAGGGSSSADALAGGGRVMRTVQAVLVLVTFTPWPQTPGVAEPNFGRLPLWGIAAAFAAASVGLFALLVYRAFAGGAPPGWTRAAFQALPPAEMERLMRGYGEG